MKQLVLFIVLLSIVAISCKKDAGEGGSATITGSVWVKDYNSTFTLLQGEYAGADEDVYIVYGDNTAGYDDKESCDYNGNFQFNFLRPGKYTIYVYSKDTSLTSPSGNITVIQEVEIAKKKETLELPQFVIFN